MTTKNIKKAVFGLTTVIVLVISVISTKNILSGAQKISLEKNNTRFIICLTDVVE